LGRISCQRSAKNRGEIRKLSNTEGQGSQNRVYRAKKKGGKGRIRWGLEQADRGKEGSWFKRTARSES